jgi:PAS domain-containing protein
MKTAETVGIVGGILAGLKGLYELLKLVKRLWTSRVERNEAITLVVESYKENTERLISITESQAKQTAMIQAITTDLGFVKAATMITAEETSLMWWRSDNEGMTIQISAQTCKFLKLAESELLGRNWFNHVPKHQHERLAKAFENSRIYKSDFDEPIEFIKGDGSMCELRAYAKFAGNDWFGIHKVLKDNIKQAA